MWIFVLKVREMYFFRLKKYFLKPALGGVVIILRLIPNYYIQISSKFIKTNYLTIK